MEISIIIPTHNRGELLLGNLAALSAQSINSDSFEVIIVADNCSDSTFQQVREFAHRVTYQISIYEKDFCNAAAARNFGASLASGKYLIFMDDDILPCTEFIEEHLKSIQENSVVLGYSKPVYKGRINFWQLRARRWWEDRFFQMSSQYHRFTFKDFFSGNVSMHTSLFRSIGGFNINLERLEDYELGLRMLNAGVNFIFASGAVGYHYEDNNLRNWLNRIKQDAESHVIMSGQFPEIKNELFETKLEITGIYLLVDKIIKHIAFKHRVIPDFFIKFLLMIADLLEVLRLRGLWDLVVGTLMEYYYWKGISRSFKNIKEFISFSTNVEVSKMQAEQDYSITEILSKEGLQYLPDNRIFLTSNNKRVLSILNSQGSEKMQMKHLKSYCVKKIKQIFIPDLSTSL